MSTIHCKRKNRHVLSSKQMVRKFISQKPGDVSCIQVWDKQFLRLINPKYNWADPGRRTNESPI